MLQEATFFARSETITMARVRARAVGRTLEAVFHEGLDHYVQSETELRNSTT